MITTPIVLSSMADLIPQGTALPMIPKSVHLRGQKPLKLPLQAGKWWSLPPCSLVSDFKDVHFQHFSMHRNGTMIPTYFSGGSTSFEATVQLQPWIAHGPKGLLPCRKFKFWPTNQLWLVSTRDFDSPLGCLNFGSTNMFHFHSSFSLGPII